MLLRGGCYAAAVPGISLAGIRPGSLPEEASAATAE
jgi:hypothetical protein